MANKKATVRTTRAVKPVVDPKAEAAAKRSEAARKAAITRKANAEAKKAEEARKALIESTGIHAPVETEPKKRDWNWLLYVITSLVLLALVVLIWLSLRGNTPAPVANAPVQQVNVVQATEPVVQPTVVVQPTQPVATEALVATEAPAGTDYQGTDQCMDGKILANQFADLSRVPAGTLEGASVWEISWTGNGFGGYDRIVLIVPRMDSSHMAFVRNAKTIHGIQYCGFMADIVAYSPTHVDALLQSSQDDQGNRPDPAEIGIFMLNMDGSVTEIRAAPKGLTVEAVSQRVIMTP